MKFFSIIFIFIAFKTGCEAQVCPCTDKLVEYKNNAAEEWSKFLEKNHLKKYHQNGYFWINFYYLRGKYDAYMLALDLYDSKEYRDQLGEIYQKLGDIENYSSIGCK